jgi:predicted short-subunit dehydrogenase-like oxidoreductase (DUF2520 family)
MNLSRPYILWIGRGRLARHLMPVWQRTLSPTYDSKNWDRSQTSATLENLIEHASIIALAISDRAIEEFHRTYLPLNPQAHWIHFSGAQEFAGLQAFHPLMSFGLNAYDEQTYRQIPYVTAAAAAGPLTWPAHLQLPNALIGLPARDKAKYHALCVLSGNFATLLWEKSQREFVNLGLDPQLLKPYAEICLGNVFADRKQALTGPLVRGDLETMNRNLQALAGDPFANVYRAFQQAVAKENS